MASHILHALELGGMPMHAAGYLELAGWATDELRTLDFVALLSLRDGAPQVLHDIVENVLYERCDSPESFGGVQGLVAHCASRALLQRLRRPHTD